MPSRWCELVAWLCSGWRDWRRMVGRLHCVYRSGSEPKRPGRDDRCEEVQEEEEATGTSEKGEVLVGRCRQSERPLNSALYLFVLNPSSVAPGRLSFGTFPSGSAAPWVQPQLGRSQRFTAVHSCSSLDDRPGSYLHFDTYSPSRDPSKPYACPVVSNVGKGKDSAA